MKEVLQKYFKDDKRKYYTSSDAHKDIEGDTSLSYQFSGDKVQLWFDGENGGVCLLVTNNPELLEALIKALIN